MVTDEDVLSFFRNKLPEQGTLTFKRIPLKLDDALQDYCDPDDVVYAITDFGERFDIDVCAIDCNNYYPWKVEWFFRKWFTKKPVLQTKKPLTVRMFAESAKAGRWLYD